MKSVKNLVVLFVMIAAMGMVGCASAPVSEQKAVAKFEKI
jgi:hypothetical protein